MRRSPARAAASTSSAIGAGRAQLGMGRDVDGLAHRGEGLLVATETVVQDRAGLRGERRREALPARRRIRGDVLDQRRQLRALARAARRSRSRRSDERGCRSPRWPPGSRRATTPPRTARRTPPGGRLSELRSSGVAVRAPASRARWSSRVASSLQLSSSQMSAAARQASESQRDSSVGRPGCSRNALSAALRIGAAAA